jgi:hypothetical protein
MTYTEQDKSFFEELEATTKRLSVAAVSNRTTCDLRMLFDELRERMDAEDAVARGAASDRP